MSGREGYVILRERADETWEIVGMQSEHSQIRALNAALNGHDPEAGRWAAVPGRYWQPRALKPRMIYDFVEEPVA